MHELFVVNLGELSWTNPLDGVNRLRPVPGYLIRTTDGRQIVVDTGNPLKMVGETSVGPDAVPVANIRPEDDLLARLLELGTTPAKIDFIISSHFDFDHCGRHDLFGSHGTRVIVQRRHLAFARTNDRCDPALWNIDGLVFETVDGDAELLPGITLLETPGHVEGHQSLLIETTAGPVLLAIDSIIDESTLADPLKPTWYFPDHDRGVQSRDRVLQIAAKTGAFVIMGHDVEQMAHLVKSPDPFRLPLKPFTS